MKSVLRILLLEDNPADAELILAALEREGIKCEALRVESRADFISALERHDCDLVLSDCSLPSFDGFSALKIAQEKVPHAPFILVSGTVGEELAIETLKSGATDYVMKHRLSRLGPAVRRAVAEYQERVARQQAERSRSEAESMFRVLFEQVAVGVAIADLNGRIVKANPALHGMLGYDEGDLPGIELSRLTHGDDTAAAVEAYQLLRSGTKSSYELEHRLICRNGAMLWGRVVTSLIREDDGSPRFAVSLIEDITHRKEMERRFIQAQKMEVVGRLAAGFAHDFNNLLTVINGYSQLMLGRVPPEDPSSRELEEIRGAGERASTLTRRLLSFSRQQVPQRKILDLNSVVTGLERMLRRLIGDQILLTIRQVSKPIYLEADQTQLEQIIMNLAINARDAMPDGGELTVATSETRPEGTGPQRGLLPGDYVVLEVTDTGHGMDVATQARIFEPFFTTKEVSKGTGLGLWMVHDVITQSRGAIAVDSERGRGTSFRIWLPQVNDTQRVLKAAALATSRNTLSGSETIMLVETDDAVREFAFEILRPAGYRVLVARDGYEAIDTAQREASQFHLLMTDIVMPSMRGSDLAARLISSRPGMKVLFLAGYPDDLSAAELPSRRGAAYLRKPLTEEALLQGVRDVLDTRPDVTIVVVDDDPAIRSFLVNVLRPVGYSVLEASNGRQAVQYLHEENVDLLISDLMMPDQGGLETIQAATKGFPDLRIIAMSGGFGGQFLSIAKELGAHEILQKPFETNTVREIVRRLLRKSDRQDASRLEKADRR